MNFMINIDIKKPVKQVSYADKILLTGSCFTEHIGNSLQDLKFNVLQNPNGILFDPVSVTRSLVSYIQNKQYSDSEIFQLNELWNSWQHHSRFSGRNSEEVLKQINKSQTNAHNFLKVADWIIITLGSAFSYRLTEKGRQGSKSYSANGAQQGVANCHRAPAQWFTKYLLQIEEITQALDDCSHQLLEFNPKLNIIFTISPVRHIRDGVMENNRSKARLIEAVHQVIDSNENSHYFPAYELVIDVLRDYRFYDVDLVHPNYMATEFVLEKFSENFIDDQSRNLMEELRKISIARRHKPFQPDTTAHSQFLKSHLEKTKALQEKYPFLQLTEELNYFSGNNL